MSKRQQARYSVRLTRSAASRSVSPPRDDIIEPMLTELVIGFRLSDESTPGRLLSTTSSFLALSGETINPSVVVAASSLPLPTADIDTRRCKSAVEDDGEPTS